MARFSKKGVIDKNFKDDDCDQFKDVKDYIARKSPEWETKIADMEKRAALKKLKESIIEDNKPEGDLLFVIYSKYKIEIEKIGIWGAIIFGAILLLMMSSCFGGSNVEEAPPTTTTISSHISSSVSGTNGIPLLLVGIIVIGILLTAVSAMLRGGFFEA